MPQPPGSCVEVSVSKHAGTWDCNVCGAFGTGGTDGFTRHYMRLHYSTTELQGRDSTPHDYGNNA